MKGFQVLALLAALYAPATVRAMPSQLADAGAPTSTAEPARPEPPRQLVNTEWPALKGRRINVRAGGDLQDALNRAQGGDQVVLARGAVFRGNYVLPKKTTAGWIVVRAESIAVAVGQRMQPSFGELLPRVETANSAPAFVTAPGASHWRLAGFEVAKAPGTGLSYGLIFLGLGSETSIEAQPSHIVLDRMYIHGSTDDDLQRCITFNGRNLAAIDSWISECHAKGIDSQGIIGWNGPGPFHIENNHIEGAGQAIMFGGADPRIRDVLPADIVIRRNHLYKPMSWANGRWTVKATFEMKNGKRVLFEGNVLENHWADAQTGFAILLQTLADQNTSWEWTTVQDVLIQHNVLTNSASGINVLSRVAYNGGQLPTNPTSRIAVVNNLMMNVCVDPISSRPGRVFQLLGDLRDITIVSNTIACRGKSALVLLMEGAPIDRLRMVNNLLPIGEYGVFGGGKGPGKPALEFYAPRALFRSNVLPGQPRETYPAGNAFPLTGPPLPGSKDGWLEACVTLRIWTAQNGSTTAGVNCQLLNEHLR